MQQHHLELSATFLPEDILASLTNYLHNVDVAKLSQSNRALYLYMHEKLAHIFAFESAKRAFKINISNIVMQIAELEHTLAYSDCLGDALSAGYETQANMLKQNISLAHAYNAHLLKQRISDKQKYVRSYEEIERKCYENMIR
ncbi:MAG: hypothetical protein LW825_01730 [Candidatus Jidaibacter sp.]|jgi:hypothetical protein|nr:hypothetical protein [Candidatus Jidaibacter sp.]